jgi:carbonic anhydrase/SulP family sulfate permease
VGLLGGIPITSVIVRSSVNINAGAQTKLAAIFHGVLLLVCVMLFPVWLNLIPLSCLAAILVVTGIKLASPELVRQMWRQGRYQFIPFVVTVVAIVLTDLLVGILIGMAISVSFILNSNLRRPVRQFVEKHLGGDVLHIELANQVSFLNRAALAKVLDGVPRGGQVLLDAQSTDYIDPDVLSMIRDFKDHKARARGVQVSFIGFRNKYSLQDEIQYVDYSTQELQDGLTPGQVLQILKDGHDRFRSGHRLTRIVNRQVSATAQGQHPLAVVLGCIDSRSPAELIFDAGLGDIFSVRVAGSILSRKVLGSIEYACAMARAKLVLVLGHTHCGAVTAAVDLMHSTKSTAEATGCQHVEFLLQVIQEVIDPQIDRRLSQTSGTEHEELIDEVARLNVLRTVAGILQQSQTLANLVREGRIAIVGAMYDVSSGNVTFLGTDASVIDVAAAVEAT